MARTRYRALARIEKTVGRQGEVVAVAASGLPLLLASGLEVWVVPPPLRGARSHTIEACDASGSGARVRLSGIRDLDASARLVGKTLLARVDDLPEDFALRDRRALLGMEVIDELAGPLGSIEEVLAGDLQDVWVVRGGYGEVLVPVSPDLVSIEDGVARTKLPQGLVGSGERA